MRKSLALSTLALAATMALTACGGAASSSPTAPSAEPVGQTKAAVAPDTSKSARGNIIKKVGEGMSITDTLNGDKEVVNFVVNSIAPITCTEKYAQPAKNGNLMAVDVTVETKPELANAIMKTFSLSSYDFKFVSANGTTFNGDLGGSTYGCLPEAATFPMAGMGPGEKITAKVVIDVPEPSGVLVLKAPMSNTNGWEFNF
jgi:hypothetical protein